MATLVAALTRSVDGLESDSQPIPCKRRAVPTIAPPMATSGSCACRAPICLRMPVRCLLWYLRYVCVALARAL